MAALALPAAMAYAGIAAVPLTVGLYGLLLPVLAYAVFGTAPRLVSGPRARCRCSWRPLWPHWRRPGAAVRCARGLAVLVGVVYLAARLIRLGWVADYFSQAVLVGYLGGVAVVLILGQLGKLVGLSSDENNAIREQPTSSANSATPAGQRCWSGRSPSPLIVIGRFGNRLPPRSSSSSPVSPRRGRWTCHRTASSHGSGAERAPVVEVPDVRADVGRLVTGALAIFLVGFSDSILTARSFAARHHEVVDADQELLAFGFANVAAGFTQSMPVAASGSRTAVNDDMGATSQVSGLAAAATIAVILVFLTGPIQYLPSAVLGAVIVFAAAKLIDLINGDPARSSRAEVVIAAITTLFITVGVLQAIAVAVLLSVADVVRRAARPADAVLGWSPESNRYVDVTDQPDAGVTRGVVVYRIQDRMFFANAHFFKRRLWAAVDGAPKPVLTSSGRFLDQRRRRQRRGRSAEVIDGLADGTSSSGSRGRPSNSDCTSTRSASSPRSAPITSTTP